MKALAIDSAVTRFTVAAKNDDNIFISTYDIGMKQSENIVPAIEYALSKAGITAAELDYCTLCSGPGSFTGLRLAFAALKAIELAFSTPVYGVPTLKVYEYPFTDLEMPVLTCIDANKDRYYARISEKGNEILPDGDYEIPALISAVSKYSSVFIAGPDCRKFEAVLKAENSSIKIITVKKLPSPAEALFDITEKMIEEKKEPLKDFEGPVYLRASEAEVVLQQKNAAK